MAKDKLEEQKPQVDPDEEAQDDILSEDELGSVVGGNTSGPVPLQRVGKVGRMGGLEGIAK